MMRPTVSFDRVLGNLRLPTTSRPLDSYADTLPQDIMDAIPEIELPEPEPESLAQNESVADQSPEFAALSRFATSHKKAAPRDTEPRLRFRHRPESVVAEESPKTRWHRITAAYGAATKLFDKRGHYAVKGNQQITTPGFTVPLKAYLAKTLIGPLQKGVDNVPVHFYALAPSGAIIDIGEAVTNANGQATAYFSPEQTGEYKVFYQFGDGALRVSHEHGTLSVLPQDKPVIAIDADYIAKTHGDYGVSELVSLVNNYQGPYRLVAITSSQESREALMYAGLNAPIVVNDYHSSPFRRLKSGYGETQLEKLKRLKFEGGLPVVGFVSRPFKSRASYLPTGIEIIPFDDVILNPFSFETTVYGKMLKDRFSEFNRALTTKSREDFYWDGMTQSHISHDNRFEFFTSNTAAENELFRLINGAQSFFDLANYAIHNDEFGHRVLARLKDRAQESPPIRVRIIFDEMSQGPLPTDKGFSWMDQAMLDELTAAGVEIVHHRMFHPPDDDQAMRGLLTRRHSKIAVTDYQDANTQLQIVVHGGGRIIGSMAYDEMRLDAGWFYRNLVRIGRGSFRDLSFTVTGPIVQEVSGRWNADFRDYGGVISETEERRTLAPILPKQGQTAARYITHQSYENQNCHNVIMHFFKHPTSRKPFSVNSFYPTDEIVDTWITGARNGKKLTVVFSLFWWADAKRNKLIPRLIKEGINVIVVPYQLHTKLYGNEDYIATGNQNLEVLSQHDSEDLWLMRRGQGDAVKLEAYYEKLLQDGFHLSDMFGPDADPDKITEYVENITNTVPFTHKAFSHHKLPAALVQLTWFIGHAIYQGARDWRPWHLMDLFQE